MVDAENIIQKVLEKIAIELRYDNHTAVVKKNCSDSGLTALLYRATVSAEGKPTLKMFIKVVVFNREIRDTVLDNIFERELWFYTDLARTFDRIQDQHNVRGRDRFLLPKFYGCHAKYLEETFVFEDITIHGFKALSNHEVMDWEYASKVVEELAKFHALSMAYGQEEPEQYRKIIKKTEFVAALKFPFTDYFKKKVVDQAIEYVKEEHKDRLFKFLKERWVWTSESPFYKPLRCPVVTHGDLKINNVMRRRTPDGSLQVILFDYQLLAIGSVVSDLMFLIFTGTDQQFRKQHFRQLLEHYYESLKQKLSKLGVDCDTVYPRQYFDEELETLLPYGLIAAVQILPLLLVEESGLPKVQADIVVTDVVSQPSPEYAIRLNEVVDEFVEWGIL